MKKAIINEINTLKSTAIKYGFDYPTQNPNTATVLELTNFLAELREFIAYEKSFK
jgi:hypothetical protein